MTTLRTLPSHASLSRPPVTPVRVVAVSMGVIVLWALWAAAFNTAQYGDNVEQFNWAQSLEFGYHKHPPLPSWALGSVIKVFGPSVYWAYMLATACLLGTAWFTWLIGRELFGERVGAAAVVLWGLNMTFSQRAQLYNHNTVLILCFSATVWAAMQASRPGRPMRPAWWRAAGVAAGASLLSKYQALVPLGGLLIALAGSGHLKDASQRIGLLIAVAAALLVCAPHLVWVAHHDFSTLRYASEAVETSGPVQRLGYVVSFAANQLRLWFPALLAIAVCALTGRHAVAPPDSGIEEARLTGRPDGPAWMAGLLWFGLAVLTVMALAVGFSLRNHWGVQALQFFSLWLAWRWQRRSTIDLRRLLVVALAVHAVSLTWYAVEHSSTKMVRTDRRIDTMYPARRLAGAAIRHWRESTACPMRYVAGSMFDAGLVSLYSGGRLEVFDTASATPWVLPADLQKHGALYVLDAGDAVPAGVVDLVTFDVVAADDRGRPARTIRFGVMRPQQACSPAANY